MPCDVFISYSHVQDTFNVVSSLTEHIEAELKMKTGEAALTVFQDSKKLRGGEKWNDRLEAEVASARALIVLLSPLWLNSDYCLKEYEVFRDNNTAEFEKPIVPLLWDGIDDFSVEDSRTKKILGDLLTRQVVDWTQLRLNPRSTLAVRKAASALATDINAQLQ